MIEKTILDYLEANLDVPVYVMRPENVTPPYVVIEKTGGSETNHIRRATFAFQSYGSNLLEAIEVNEAVKDAALNLIELPDIVSSRYARDYNFTNTADKQPRYQAIFEIVHY